MKSLYLALVLSFFGTVGYSDVDSCQKFEGEFYCPDLLSQPVNVTVDIRKISSDEAYYDVYQGSLVDTHWVNPNPYQQYGAVYFTSCDGSGIKTTIKSTFAGIESLEERELFIDSTDRLVFHNVVRMAGQVEDTIKYCSRLR